jgi:DNA replication protein DnaC
MVYSKNNEVHKLIFSKPNGIKTHITTNLNAAEIEERYGERVRSRMREQFNLISFNSSSKDKRG